MTLKEYKKMLGLTYKQLEAQLGIPSSNLQRVAEVDGACLKMKDAKKIVEWANGFIKYEDLA